MQDQVRSEEGVGSYRYTWYLGRMPPPQIAQGACQLNDCQSGAEKNVAWWNTVYGLLRRSWAMGWGGGTKFTLELEASVSLSVSAHKSISSLPRVHPEHQMRMQLQEQGSPEKEFSKTRVLQDGRGGGFTTGQVTWMPYNFRLF